MLMGCMTYLKARFGSKKGQGMVEYGLIIGIVAVLIIAVFVFLDQPLRNLFTNIGDIIDGAATDVAATPATGS